MLRAMKRTPIGRWSYKRGVIPGDEREHIGPYAEDFQKNFEVGDGKTIHVADAVGVNMAATKALAKEVDQLKRRIAAIKGGVKRTGKSAAHREVAHG